MRIVSLLPSATESLCFIGGGHLLVGRSHECDFPTSVKHLPVLTAARIDGQATPMEIDVAVRESMSGAQALYTVDEAMLRALKPDVILTQDLCHVCSIDLAAVRRIASTMNPQPAIVSLNPQTFEAVLDDLMTIGRAVNMERQAIDAITRLRERIYAASEFVNAYATSRTMAMLEWTDPLFVGGHWTPQLIERAGAFHPLNPTVPIAGAGAAEGPVGITQRVAGKSVVVPPGVFVASNPEVVLIAPCGRTLEQTRADAAGLFAQPWWKGVRAQQIALVDGNQYFNRPGPRLVDAFEFLVGWLHDRPEVIPEGFAWERVR